MKNYIQEPSHLAFHLVHKFRFQNLLFSKKSNKVIKKISFSLLILFNFLKKKFKFLFYLKTQNLHTHYLNELMKKTLKEIILHKFISN